MPKLDAKTARRVRQAETSDREAVPEGTYKLQLLKVSTSAKPGASGHHYWSWEFEICDGEFKGKRGPGLVVRTSLSPDSDWKMKETFEAFEADPKVDTNTLVGQQVAGVIIQREIPVGTRKGQIGNEISALMPTAALDEDPDEDDDLDDEDDEEESDF